MILIADSGSTKCAWALIDKGEVIKKTNTSGINPYIIGEEKIAEIILDELISAFEENIRHIRFFGAGCNALGAQKVGIVLSSIFLDATIEVKSDLEGAAIAMFGNKKGICCILGTGSASGVFNGQEIVESTPSLGYILGDEASGSFFGKQLIADYFKGVMPKELAVKFELFFEKSLSETLSCCYRESFPNRFLASVAPFLSQNISHSYCNTMIKHGIRLFIDRNLKNYNLSKDSEIAFTGTVANVFKQHIIEELAKDEISKVSFCNNPIDNLANYFCK